MTATNFDKSLVYVLAYEGGFSNHPADPGGVTLHGVIQRVYDGYRRNKGLRPRPLSVALSNDPVWHRERNEIYRLNYWNQVLADELPSGVDMAVFDGAVNSGPKQAAKWLQRALGIVADGVVGEATIAAANAYPDKDKLIAKMLDLRMAFLKRLQHWKTFALGWTRRINQVRTVSQKWATGSVGADPAPIGSAGAARAYVQDAAPARSTSVADATTGVGGAIATGNASIAAAQEQLAPVVGSMRIGGYVLAALAGLGVALAVAGVAYRFWAQYENKRRADDLMLEAV